MKRIFTSLAAALLLAGCFGSGPADPVTENPPTDSNIITITDDLFIELSAKILCLPANNPESSTAEIEVLAKDLLAVGGVAEADFTAYQEGIEANPARKSEISNAIVGQMADFCSITSAEPEAEVPEASLSEDSGEDINVPTEASVNGPLDTALAEVTILSVQDDLTKIKIGDIRDYNRYPGATYPELIIGDEILVRIYDIAIAGQPKLVEGKKYIANMSVCYPDYPGGLSCPYEGWSVAIYSFAAWPPKTTGSTDVVDTPPAPPIADTVPVPPAVPPAE